MKQHRDLELRLRSLLSDHKPAPNAIARFLDHLDAQSRRSTVLGLRRPQLQQLFAVSENFAKLTLDQLVPVGLPALTPVRHFGRNSLPFFSHFEKRFYRSAKTDAIGGANFQSTSWLTGPGYFVATSAANSCDVLIDYNTVPADAPMGWPKLASNDQGLSRLVFGGMIDTLRCVSEHVSIGAASKHNRPISAYFVLCREVAP